MVAPPETEQSHGKGLASDTLYIIAKSAPDKYSYKRKKEKKNTGSQSVERKQGVKGP